MAAGSGGDNRTLQDTPTWAVAVVCAVFVLISVFIEHGIHSLGEWFQKRHKKAMIEALEKIKSELMLLGFISLLITVFTVPISKICIPAGAGVIMLPCRKPGVKGGASHDVVVDGNNYGTKKLLWFQEDVTLEHRILAGGDSSGDYCSKYNKVALISQTAIHQLHIFIFVLAIVHVLYSGVTIGLAKLKLKKWKAWEKETHSLQYQVSHDPTEFRFVHQTSFVRQHNGLSKMPVVRWIPCIENMMACGQQEDVYSCIIDYVAFFRQFFASVTKVDYLTLRHGFINAHFAANAKFDFHKYIKRSMEDDFKVVVGVSLPLWTFAAIFQLVNVYRWYTLFALSFSPPILLFIVGAKLEMIITEMAQEIQDRTTVVRGCPLVQPSNKYFWFNHPRFVLGLIHFILFQNAFEIAFFLYTLYQFGLKSCFHENLEAVLARIGLGLVCQILCSYITFPLYALVTQMGSHMKQAIFEEQTAKALKKWQMAAKERTRFRKLGENSASPDLTSGETTPSRGASPLHLLHKYKNRKNRSDDIESIFSTPSGRDYISETDFSETEGPSDDHTSTNPPHLPTNGFEITENNSMEFSFSQSNIR